MSSKFQGRRLFNATLLCGGVKNIALGQLDLASGKPSGVSHAVRAESVDVHSSTGTISFRVNSGGAADIYRVWMGDVCVFSMGILFKVPTINKTTTILDFHTQAGVGLLQDLQVKVMTISWRLVLVRASLQLTKFISGIAMLDLMVQCTKTRMSMRLMEMGIPQKLSGI